MIKEEFEKEAEKWLRKFLLCNDCKRKCHCIELNAYCEEQVLKAYIDSAEPREKRIAELEKENAELKNERNAFKIYSDGAELDAINLNDQLTKAKEIIREFVEWATWQGSNCPNFKSIQDKAEQFLKGCEVKK
jgi:phage shock protein A